MRNKSLLAAFVVFAMLLAGCSSAANVDAEFGPFEVVQALEIEIRAANLQIKEGDSLIVQTDNPHISAQVRGGVLIVQEERHYDSLDSSELTILIPEGMEFEWVSMDAGAGRIAADRLFCRDLELELGAGEAVFEALSVTGKADIEGGAGQFRIGSGSLRNLEFEMGVGDAELNAEFSGHTDIHAGVGSLRISVADSMDAYTMHLNQGIGQILVNGEACSGTIGSGSELLEIAGGIGNVELVFEK